MKILREFKDFAIKGNMMDMAIGIIIGASFNGIVNILVKKIILPPIAYMSNGINLKDKRVVLQEASEGVSAISVDYGELIEAFIDFFIIGLVLFIVVKVMNKLMDRAQDPRDSSIKTPKNIQLLSDISDSLKKQNELLEKKKQP
tara:strand:+ start:179721 stop:180152 length:432 start_codon:yes stop_codon:yes gene_type:complete